MTASESPATLLIDGEWVAAANGATFDSIDPATGLVIATLADAQQSEVDDAVAAARAAFESADWAGLLPNHRARLLFRLADLLETHIDEIALLETRDQGQPLWASRGGVKDSADHLRYFAGWVTKLSADSTPLSIPNLIHRAVREPLGVCGLITPWNFPLVIAVWKIAPALATGNTVIVKPAEQTPLTTVRLAELALEAGFPKGVFNVLTGGVQAGRALVAHPGVAKISFTGSTIVGREIAEIAGRRLATVSLELGGKTPSIVTPHADIAQAVAGNLGGGLFNAGQTCAAYSRLYVHSSRVEEFTSAVVAAVDARVIGPGIDSTTEISPLISSHHRDRVHSFVQGGVAQGAELVAGGAFAEVEGYGGGFYYKPTVFSSVDDQMTIAREEIFGPVLSILSYEDEDEVIARANGSEFGLAAAVWSREIGEANRIADRISAGTVWINSASLLDVGSPWGGFKSSGSGREMGWEAVLAFTGVKSVITNIG